MARRSGFLSAMMLIQRSAARAARASAAAQNARIRAANQAARAAERAARAAERASATDERERARLYAEQKVDEAEAKNEQLNELMDRLESLLAESLAIEHVVDLDRLKEHPEVPVFQPGALAKPGTQPYAVDYMPAQPSGLRRMFPGVKAKHEMEVVQAHGRFETDLRAYEAAEETRLAHLAEAKERHAQVVEMLSARTAEQHQQVETFKSDLRDGKPDAVTDYFQLVLESSDDPEGFPNEAKIAYVPESKQLVVQYELPPFKAIPEVAAFKYVKAKDEISESPRPLNQRKSVYSSVVAQLALRTVHQLFGADLEEVVQSVVLNCHVDAIDKGTGRSMHPCLVTLRTTRDAFLRLDLSKVDPVTCLKALNASVSKSPAELVPVRPVLEFDMVDPRFVQEADVLSGLDQRPNLMALTPSEFESLITNLFQAMGLEARQTQASRDGGVDCVAFDPRPIFGGKVVIQAKRYKNTVGVSAVRDLFGTVQNEGASKGILVTTSGYGKASYDFAQGKPLELLSGSNLLYLLKEHAKIEAKIETPEDWKDPVLDVETS